jgi:hypothetical protein
MSTPVDVTVDVLASDPAEIKNIKATLQEPCEKLIAWYTKKCDENHVIMATDIKEVVAFRQICKLGYVHESVNKSRRFDNCFEYEYSGLVWTHLHFVSERFPKAIFLAQYSNILFYGGKIVIRNGREIRASHFNDWVCEGSDDSEVPQWASPNIFAPYQEEYNRGVEFGSLWDEWVKDMRKAVAGLEGDDSPQIAQTYACPSSQDRLLES